MHVVVAVFVLGSVASAQDRGQAAQAARDVMRQAMLARISMPRDLPMRPDAMMSRGAEAYPAAAAAAHVHMARMQRSEAEQAAHSRAAAHGMWQPGAARREQDRRPTGEAMHGGSTGWDDGHMGCGDAAGNTRNMDMHGWWNGSGGWSGGGGMPMGGGPMGMRAADPAGASTPAPPPTR